MPTQSLNLSSFYAGSLAHAIAKAHSPEMLTSICSQAAKLERGWSHGEVSLHTEEMLLSLQTAYTAIAACSLGRTGIWQDVPAPGRSDPFMKRARMTKSDSTYACGGKSSDTVESLGQMWSMQGPAREPRSIPGKVPFTSPDQ